MVINKIQLKGYKRLFLSRIKYLEFRPEKRINIILGRGGSGKSSLFRELSPLPANLTSDYEDKGYKKIYITHNKSKYVLTSGVNGGKKHSFIIDGEELNNGGTRKVQLILVKEHFKITPDIHEIMLGVKGLTTMSTAERKNWFTNISNVDYTYILGLYNKAKQRNRDVIGAIKIAQSELVKDQDNILSKNEVNKLKKDLQVLKGVRDLLINSKRTVADDTQVQYDDIKDLSKQAVRLLRNIKPPELLKNSGSVKTDIGILNNDIIRLKEEINNNKKKLKEISIVEEANNKDKALTKSKIAEVRNKISNIVDKIYINIADLERLPELDKLFRIRYSDICEGLGTLREYDDVQFTIAEHEQHVNEYNNNKDRLFDINNTMTILQSTRDNIVKQMNDSKVKCPKCDHEWSVVYDVKEYNFTTVKIDKLAIKIEEYTRKNKILKTYIDRYNLKRDILNNIKRLFMSENNYILRPILQYLESKVDIFESPEMARDLLYKLSTDIKEWLKISIYTDQLNVLLKDEQLIDAKDNIMVSNITDTKESIEHKLSDNILLLSKLENTLKEYITYDKQVNLLVNMNTKLTSSLTNAYKNTIANIDNLANKAINDSILKINLDIVKLEDKLTDVVYSERNIIDNKKKIKKLTDIRTATGLLIETMSPNSGLIAKSITHFLNAFVNDMNDIINNVWNYEMKVLPCSITDSLDLDYKFPIQVDNRDIIEDVSKTSSSMKEIINLAFKIVSMKYLGMTEYPLYLDEYGSSFDDAHRIKAYQVIDTLSSSSFNQIFIISHFETSYSRFVNADVSVLDSENLLLNPKMKINEVLLIE